MSYLETYLDRAENSTPGSSTSLRLSAENFLEKHLSQFNFNEHVNGLLFGHVQSGKTGQMFAVASIAADSGFGLFVLVTTDNVMLHKQTLERAKKSLGGFLDGFTVLGETDDAEFLGLTTHRNPVLIVLKKNVSVLKHWVNHISSNAYFSDKPIFILDDEGDAASLNTKINKDDQSTIFTLLEKMRSREPSSFFLHVTATPQSLLLQAKESGWRPGFAHYIAPGTGYLGGDFFYSETSSCVRPTPDNEKDILVSSNDIPEGLRKAVLSYLVAGSHILLSKERKVCTLLIHPGTRIAEHDTAKEKIEKFLQGVKEDVINDSQTFRCDIQDAWNDLASTKPGLSSIEEILEFLKKGLPQINVVALNSKTTDGVTYDSGLNVVVGGNNLGRGVTFPGLQTVYYCRSSKTPQADTCWQHARIFGYDRDAGLCRIFMPPVLAKLFKELNDANNALFAVLREKGSQAVSILMPHGTKPTRMSVVKAEDLAILVGNVNYFPSLPLSENLDEINDLIGIEEAERNISLDEALKVIELVKVEKGDPWSAHNFPNCIRAIQEQDPLQDCRLIVRVGRNIKKGTGTLLSQNDRELGDQYTNKLVLTMYQLKGDVEKGWNGKPLWVSNVKFAEGTCFYLSAK